LRAGGWLVLAFWTLLGPVSLTAQIPRAEVAGGGSLVLPAEGGPGLGWRVEAGFPAAGPVPATLLVGGGAWTSPVRRAGDPLLAAPITGELRSAFAVGALRLERSREGYFTALAGGFAVHHTRADLQRETTAGADEVRAMEGELGGLRAGPTAALTLVQRPLLGRWLHADLTLRRSWVPGIQPWELSAGVALRPRRAAAPAERRPAPPPGIPAPVRRPPDALLASLERVAAAAGFEVLDADDGWRLVIAGDAFPSASAALPPGVRDALGEVGALLAAAAARVRVIGHTDHTGPERVNQRLSERRALAVLDALRLGGLEPELSSALGYGSAMPRAPGDTPAGRAANRRVEIVVSDG
jgi:flagellar motor protein MotB